jgi:hypothetical protein
MNEVCGDDDHWVHGRTIKEAEVLHRTDMLLRPSKVPVFRPLLGYRLFLISAFSEIMAQPPGLLENARIIKGQKRKLSAHVAHTYTLREPL